ncbi:endonuclease [Saxibacter everestensis]|uniref:Endonuclease n=1 Tax=Saxibacter everestensis TaxID=2909229 RepID=A0ABY8QTR7_9MICO|nr:endonuclease [Brevibacteriaceae bacterium ZFBP1038]
MTKPLEKTVAALLQRHGKTYAEEAEIGLKDTPSPLYQLLVLSTLLSARISADIAVAAARELFSAGYKTPEKMAAASWQQRVNALGRGHYRRYDERTSTMLGEGAELLQQKFGGDLRRLRRESEGTGQLIKGLQLFPGIGPTGAGIFCREAQGVWPELAPYLDKKVLDGAKRLGLPDSAKALSGLVGKDDLPRFAAACVRAALDKDIVEEVKQVAG